MEILSFRLVLELLTIMLSADQIVGFLRIQYLKNEIQYLKNQLRYEVDFFHMSNILIRLRLTLLSMPKVFQNYKSEIHSKDKIRSKDPVKSLLPVRLLLL